MNGFQINRKVRIRRDDESEGRNIKTGSIIISMVYLENALKSQT